MFIGYSYLPSPSEIRKKRAKNITEKLEDFNRELNLLHPKLSTLRSDWKRIKYDESIPTYEKNKQLRKIERQGNAVKREINHIKEQIVLRQSRLQTTESPGSHTHCYSCGASIDRKSILRCPVCRGAPCPKCFACLCSYNGNT